MAGSRSSATHSASAGASRLPPRSRRDAPRHAPCVIVEVPNKPGMLRSVTERLAAESIDIRHLYATAAEDEHHSLLALDRTNNDHAVVVLNR